MKTVEDYEAIRRAYFVEAQSIRAIHRRMGYDRETIRKAIVHPTPQPYQLTQPLMEILSQLKLSGFRTAFEEQLQNPRYAELSFEDRLVLLVDIEITRRANNRLRRRIKSARFPLQATIEDLDLSAGRGFKRAQILQLAQGQWV